MYPSFISVKQHQPQLSIHHGLSLNGILCCCSVGTPSLQPSSTEFDTVYWRGAAHLMYPGQRSDDGSDNKPGPGVSIYLMPMGAGQTKGDSTRGWGTPLHTFWCCYGSAVESFSKVADSIFFYRCSISASFASCRVGCMVQLHALDGALAMTPQLVR